VTPHVRRAKSATGPSALIASQMDWSSQRVSWWFISRTSCGWWF
jgi:hypothetical protein